MLINVATAAPIVLGLASAALWGGADFAGGLSARRGRPGSVVLVAHGTSLALLLGLILLTHPKPLSGFNWAWGLVSGAAGGVALMLFYEALAVGAMGLSAALAGVLTAALPVGVSLLREGRPGWWQVAGFLVAAVAIGLIAWSPELPAPVLPGPAPVLPGSAPGPGKPVPPTSLRSLALSAVAGLGFGLQLVVLHLASAQGSVLRALTLSRVGGTAAGAAAVLLALVRGRGILPAATPQASHGLINHPAVGSSGMRASARTFLLLALLTGLLDTAGNGLYMFSALAGRLDVAAVLASLYPGATILLAIWLLKERSTPLQTAGMGLALIAVALISV
jgi:drug/metabolite transporter (DMT)-like permease